MNWGNQFLVRVLVSFLRKLASLLGNVREYIVVISCSGVVPPLFWNYPSHSTNWIGYVLIIPWNKVDVNVRYGLSG